MKVSSLVLLILSLSVISANALASERSQATWGGKIVLHVKKHWDLIKDSSSEIQNEYAKVKLTVSNSGQVSGAIELSCTGSITFCSSVSKAITKANPFPVPPANLEKNSRTLLLSLD